MEPNSSPLVSVIIPTKNSAHYLAAALESVVSQSYRPVEILVVDAKSVDETVAIAQSFPLTRLLVQTGVGLSDAWNCGIAAAQGDLIAFLDSDDQWRPGRLDQQVAYMQQHPEVQYSITQARHILEAGRPCPPTFRPEILDKDLYALIPGALMARRQLFDQVGAFKTNLAIAGDLDWFFRLNDFQICRGDVPFLGLIKVVRGESLSVSTEHSALYRRELVAAARMSIQRRKVDSDNRF